MAAAEPTGESRLHEAVLAGRTDEDLTALVAKLGDDLLRLVDGKLGLMKLDIEDEARRYGRELVAWAMAAVVIAVGLAACVASLAFALASVLPVALDPLLQRAVAFGAVGLFGIVAGWIVLRRGGARLGTHAQATVDAVTPSHGERG